MKKTRIAALPDGIPTDAVAILAGGDVYDSSSSPEARVYFIDRGDGFFLKRAERGTLSCEADMTAYFHTLGIGAELLGYFSNEYDWLLTRRVVGEDCTHLLHDPKRLADTIGAELRRLHETDFSACPIKDRTSRYLALAEGNYLTGNYDKSNFPDSFGYRSADEAYAVLREGCGELRSDVLIHGDYCLPNVMFNGWEFSSFIDVGNGGVGDRHVDLFWGAWTLAFNLHTDAYRDRFLDAYGRDRVDEEKLRLIAAAEVFG